MPDCGRSASNTQYGQWFSGPLLSLTGFNSSLVFPSFSARCLYATRALQYFFVGYGSLTLIYEVFTFGCVRLLPLLYVIVPLLCAASPVVV